MASEGSFHSVAYNRFVHVDEREMFNHYSSVQQPRFSNGNPAAPFWQNDVLNKSNQSLPKATLIKVPKWVATMWHNRKHGDILGNLSRTNDKVNGNMTTMELQCAESVYQFKGAEKKESHLHIFRQYANNSPNLYMELFGDVSDTIRFVPMMNNNYSSVVKNRNSAFNEPKFATMLDDDATTTRASSSFGIRLRKLREGEEQGIRRPNIIDDSSNRMFLNPAHSFKYFIPKNKNEATGIQFAQQLLGPQQLSDQDSLPPNQINDVDYFAELPPAQGRQSLVSSNRLKSKEVLPESELHRRLLMILEKREDGATLRHLQNLVGQPSGVVRNALESIAAYGTGIAKNRWYLKDEFNPKLKRYS